MTRTPRLEIAVEVDSAKLPIPRSRLHAEVARALAAAGFRGSLSLAVVSDETMRRVNREFHGCDEATDVLAFPLRRPDGETTGQATEEFDAEVVVSLDTARRVARSRGELAAAELMLYVVHGVLHLMGHDDHDPADARRMHARTLAILEELGYATTIRTRAKPRDPTRLEKRERQRAGTGTDPGPAEEKAREARRQ